MYLYERSEAMSRSKKLNIVIIYGKSGYVVNDFGVNKSPRFELYHIPTKKSIKKSNNPYDFDKIILKNWEEIKNENIQ